MWEVFMDQVWVVRKNTLFLFTVFAQTSITWYIQLQGGLGKAFQLWPQEEEEATLKHQD